VPDILPFGGAYDDGDIDTNRSANPTLSMIVDERYSRRQTLFGGVSAMTMAALGTTLLSGCGSDADDNLPPTVTAGQNASTTTGKVVTLSATANDAGGALASTVWTQISGPTVTLTNAGTPSASFVAPAVSTATPLLFRFTATDGFGAAASADSTVTVGPAVLDFTAVPKSLADIVAVPSGYTVSVLYRLGDPINAATGAYANDGSDSGFSARAGDHHDGMSYFGLLAGATTPDANNSSRGLLVMNHENITAAYLHPNGPTLVNGARPEAEALKEMECHGVSVVEVAKGSTGGWSYVQGSTLNRRITPLTPMQFNGPVRGAALLRTRYSADGTQGRGTINNCANGHLPWGTYATCEENWAGYFRRDTTDNAQRSAKQLVALNRYGISTSSNRTGNNRWSTVTPSDSGNTLYARWNINANAAAAADGSGDFRNEANQFGWVVEIDPYLPGSTPRKRTALGRMNHEGCCPSVTVAGRKPAFYMGDDAQNEYLYKFVSDTPWSAADATPADRLATGDKYLDKGTLYVARFDATGAGVWLPLRFGENGLNASNPLYAFADQADVLTHCRLAGDAVGATKMDRPEWTAINPQTGEMYLTLTNNSSRTLANTDAANPRYYNDPKNGRAQLGNPNGHIIRLREDGDTSEATTFKWDIYLFGAGADLNPANINLSGLDASNDLSSPDGLWFSRSTSPLGQVNPLLWIQTDDGAYTDQTNCMMLAALPGTVGDGAARTIVNLGQDDTSRSQSTYVGKAPGGTLRRFLVGPKECEITGIDSTPDGRTLFVNIQHPGENGAPAAISSSWPATQAGAATGTSRPRSATIVITKNDGGLVGI
jgi:secreted PhoX family phosphatase